MSLSSKLVPSSGCLFGVYPSSSCDSATSFRQRLLNHEVQIDRTAATNGILNIVHAYHDWNDFTTTFPNADEALLAADGRLLLINWTPRIYGTTTIFLWADIAAGVHDATYVIPTARAMRDFGKPFFLAFQSEPNAGSSAQGGAYGTDAEYASAARHVHDVFAAQGATNVVWVFNPSGYTTTIPTRMNALYPGDAYVDWIGFDPYGGASSGDTVDYVLSTKYPMVNWATVTKSGSHTKPMMVVEWGKTEVSGNPNSKAQFFADLRGALKTPPYDIIKAVVYFNGVSGVSECLNTSTATLTGYKALAGDSFFNPDVSPTPPPVASGSFRASASAVFANTKSKQLVIPSTVQAGDGMLLWHTCTRAELRQAAEGTNATNVTVGNSGAKGSNPLDGVSATPPTYDTAQKHSGSSSWLAGLAAQTTRAGWWEASFGTQVSGVPYWGEKYFRIPSVPPAAIRLFQQAGVAGNPAFQWGLAIDVTTGKLVIRDGGGTNRATSTAAPATNTQHRVEWQCDWNGSTSTVIARLFLGANVDGTTPDETLTSTAFTQAAAGGRYYFGALSSAAQTWAPWVDDFRLSKNGWIGPQGTSPALTTDMATLGWTAVDSKQVVDGSVELISRLYRKTAAAGDPGSTLTLTTDVLAHGVIEMVVYSGVDQLALVDVSGTPSTKTTDSTTVVTPNATTTGIADLIVSAAFTRDNPAGLTSAWTLPGGEIQRAVAFPTGIADGRVAGIITDDGATHGVGTYGTKTFTANATSYLGIGWTVGLLSTAAASTGQRCGFLYEPV
jgi:hypothetical protein